MTGTKLRAIEFIKFDGVANRATFSDIKTNLFSCKRIDLFPKDLIVKLNIPWGELYCICTKAEWNELYGMLRDNNIKVGKKTFMASILDVSSFFFIQPMEWISDFVKQIKDKKRETGP